MYAQMQALHDVVQAGYVRYIGMSSCHAYQCRHFAAGFQPRFDLTSEFSSSPSNAECVQLPSCTPSLLLLLTAPLVDYAITHKLTPFISMQNHYSLIYREEEREMFPTLKASPPLPSELLRSLR